MRTEYNRLFDNITSDMSDDEVLFGALRKAENMENKTSKRSFKKPIIAACAAVGVLAAGVTGAAAAGWLDFNEVFGNVVLAEDQQTGIELIGDARDVQVTCSDDAYNVELKGITGSLSSAVATVEISRKDGAPVITQSSTYDLLGSVMWKYDTDDGFAKEFNMGASKMTLTEDGNILMTFDMAASKTDFSDESGLTEKRITIVGDNFYYSDAISRKMMMNSNYYWKTVGDHFGMMVDLSNGTAYSMDDIALLQLEWSVEFNYIPSQKAVMSLSPIDISEPCTLFFFKSERPKESGLYTVCGEYVPLEAEFLELTFEAKGGLARIDYDTDDINFDDYEISLIHFDPQNDTYLLRKDGTKIPVIIDRVNNQINEYGENVMYYDLAYREGYSGPSMAVDLSTIESFYVNGTVYPLG